MTDDCAATPDSVWRTRKPYVAIAVVVVGVVWWYSGQSSLAGLKDGTYDCQGVFVNQSGKYEILVDDAGNSYIGEATVRGGQVVSVGGEANLTPTDLAALTVRKNGSAHFHMTSDPAMHSYNAVACDYSG